LFFLSFRVIWELHVAFRAPNTQNKVIGRGVNKGAEEAAGGGRKRRKLRVVVVVQTENGGVSGGTNGGTREGVNEGI